MRSIIVQMYLRVLLKQMNAALCGTLVFCCLMLKAGSHNEAKPCITSMRCIVNMICFLQHCQPQYNVILSLRSRPNTMLCVIM